jgi:hypothetical protein
MPWWSIPTSTKNKTPIIYMMRIQNATSDAFPPSKGGGGDVLCHDRLFFTHFSLFVKLTHFSLTHAPLTDFFDGNHYIPPCPPSKGGKHNKQNPHHLHDEGLVLCFLIAVM